MGTLDQLTGTPVTLPNFEDWTTVTCTSSWTTNTTLTAKRMVFGTNAYYDVNVALSGAPNSGDLTIVLPTGDVIATASMASPANISTVIQGSANINDTGIRAYVASPLYQNTAQIQIGHGAGTGNIGITNQLNPITFGAGDNVSVKFTVPLVRLAGGMTVLGAGLATSVKAGLLNYYDTGSFVANFNSGMNTSTNNVTITYARLGPVVTLTFPSLLVTVGVTSAIWQSAAGTVPTSLRPSSTVTCSGTLAITNKVEPGTYGITSSGQLNLYRSGEANFTSGTTQCGIYFSTITYSVQ